MHQRGGGELGTNWGRNWGSDDSCVGRAGGAAIRHAAASPKLAADVEEDPSMDEVSVDGEHGARRDRALG
jgi:hypothetical protein